MVQNRGYGNGNQYDDPMYGGGGYQFGQDPYLDMIYMQQAEQSQGGSGQGGQSGTGKVAGTAGSIAGSAAAKYGAGKILGGAAGSTSGSAAGGAAATGAAATGGAPTTIMINGAGGGAAAPVGTVAGSTTTAAPAMTLPEAGTVAPASTGGGAAGAGYGSMAANAAGVAAGAYAMYEGGKNVGNDPGYDKDLNPKSSWENAKKDPIGTLGRAMLFVNTGGTSNLMVKYSPLAKLLFGKSQTKVEDERYGDLKKKGIAGFTGDFKKTQDPHAWHRDDLAKDHTGFDSKGEWNNNKFAYSRDKKDLRAEDIWGYAAFGEKYGNDWLGGKYSEADRRQIAGKLLAEGRVKEHKGTVDIDWKGFDEGVKAVIDGKSDAKKNPQSTKATGPNGQTVYLRSGKK